MVFKGFIYSGWFSTAPWDELLRGSISKNHILSPYPPHCGRHVPMASTYRLLEKENGTGRFVVQSFVDSVSI